MSPNTLTRPLVVALAACLLCTALPAATYMPMSDTDLMVRSPIIVRAVVTWKEVRQEDNHGASQLFTIVTLQRLELLKGSIGETFTVRLGGGRLGSSIWLIPGTPAFVVGQEVVLFLGPAGAGHSGEYRLTEFGLSKFDLVADAAGRRFAVRPVFSAEEDLIVSARAEAPADGAQGRAVLARDAESFLEALRSYSRGRKAKEIVMAEPSAGLGPDFINVSGVEPGLPGSCGDVPCLVRWFWDTSVSPDGVLSTTGTQSNLKNDEPNCGTDSVCDVKNAATQWHGVAQSDVHYSGPTAGGNIPITLDATSSFDGGMAWNTPLDGCPVQGVVGLGGPGGDSAFLQTFKGDADYFPASAGQVTMRKVTCSTGYSAKAFRSAVLHEVGHTLGLGHPDLGQSIHSTTSSTDWNNAVMRSVIPSSFPGTPQTDDIRAVQYYYGTAVAGAAPAAGFSFSPSSPVAGTAVTFADSSTGSPTGYSWDFGDGTAYGTGANPSHTFASAGSYTVTLYAGNPNGTGTAAKTITVAPGGGGGACTADDTTLCLSGSRFKVTATFQKPNDIQRTAHAVTLTDQTGYFWFLVDTNVEVVTKVLPFCANPYNSIWVFAAGLTNVKVDLTYLDTKTNTTVTKSNAQGAAFEPVQDTKAFKTCP